MHSVERGKTHKRKSEQVLVASWLFLGDFQTPKTPWCTNWRENHVILSDKINKSCIITFRKSECVPLKVSDQFLTISDFLRHSKVWITSRSQWGEFTVKKFCFMFLYTFFLYTLCFYHFHFLFDGVSGNGDKKLSVELNAKIRQQIGVSFFIAFFKKFLGRWLAQGHSNKWNILI